ncbi:MATE family efflux transporter [Ruminococcus sp. FMB-CY1]|uniref:MATE family efflux transporter n=1 Tax=unclassified Ruminococcus TaxID=2608920 RepID=UPI00208F3613|nr:MULTISPECIES: MATE family efflux transporter [unclassified Ruminococcus]USP70179.1 MATE family efflux transporter [Ruminococcus sp. FMBCY1]WBX56505.1 MATE family efflux transporter [Ruminococcus sp. FMB-CY1]
MEKELKKQKLDMLNGSIWNKLPVFALPIAATGILEQLFNASDIAIVGNFAQTDKTAAVAAVGANSPIIGLILNLFIGIALGANVVIANAIGRDDKQTVQKAVHTSMVVSVIGGVLVAIIGELIAEPLLTALNVPNDVLELALLYLRIYFLGMPVILLYNFEAAIFRSIGETKMPLIALTLSGILNVLLNLFFVIVLKMSVNGVATATVLANVVSAGILYIKLVKSDKYIKVEFKKLRIDGKVFAKIMQIGLPAGIQSAVFAVANIVIQGAINSLGTVVIAASSAAFNIEIIAYNVMNSFSQACTTFVGQNFGANKLDRCKKTLFLCLIEDAIASGTAILIVLITGKFLLSIFNNNPEVIEIGYTRLVIIFIAYIFSMLYEVMSGYLRGFGFSLVPAILTTVGVCVLRIIWINTVFPANRTFVTIMTAYPVSLATTAVLIFIALIIYRPSKRFANKGKEKA